MSLWVRLLYLYFFFQAILFGYFCCTLAFDAELKQRKNFVLITLLLYCEFCAVFYGRESSNRPQCLCWLTKYQVLKLCTHTHREHTSVHFRKRAFRASSVDKNSKQKHKSFRHLLFHFFFLSSSSLSSCAIFLSRLPIC